MNQLKEEHNKRVKLLQKVREDSKVNEEEVDDWDDENDEGSFFIILSTKT